MPILTATSGDVLLKPGVYDAVITEVAVKERDDRKFLVWAFEVQYAGNKTTRVRRPTSMSFGPKSTARAFAEAALGRKIKDGEQVDTDDLVGLPVQVVITRGTRSDGEETNRVESVLPAKAEDELPF
jgi:hypothetical protein